MVNSKRIIFIIVIFFVLLSLAREQASADFIYQSAGNRDPFVPLLGSGAARTVSGLKGVLAKEDLTLQGVLLAVNGKKQAVVNGEILGEGDSVGSVQVVSISDNAVRIKFKETEFDLVLYD